MTYDVMTYDAFLSHSQAVDGDLAPKRPGHSLPGPCAS
jgi:hypothetical protein